MLILTSPWRTAVFLARIVMPFSRSRSIESITRSATSWFDAERAGLPQHRVDQRGLAVIDVGDDRHVADVVSGRHAEQCRDDPGPPHEFARAPCPGVRTAANASDPPRRSPPHDPPVAPERTTAVLPAARSCSARPPPASRCRRCRRSSPRAAAAPAVVASQTSGGRPTPASTGPAASRARPTRSPAPTPP